MRAQPNHRPDLILYLFKGQFLVESTDGTGAITRKCISEASARQAFTARDVDSGWIDPHTIRQGHNHRGPWVLQRYEPAQYTLHLDSPLLLPHEDTPVSTLRIPLPGFLFLGIKKTYYLWAYRAWKGEETVFYRAPLPNIYQDGSICFGQNHPRTVSGDTISDTWTLFWDSPFNEHLASEKSKQAPENVLPFLGSLHKSDSYPVDDLEHQGHRLKDLIKTLVAKPRGQERR